MEQASFRTGQKFKKNLEFKWNEGVPKLNVPGERGTTGRDFYAASRALEQEYQREETLRRRNLQDIDNHNNQKLINLRAAAKKLQEVQAQEAMDAHRQSQQADKVRYTEWLKTFSSSSVGHDPVGAQRAAEAGRRLDQRTNSSVGLSPAAQQLRLEEEQRRQQQEMLAHNQRMERWYKGSLPSDPVKARELAGAELLRRANLHSERDVSTEQQSLRNAEIAEKVATKRLVDAKIRELDRQTASGNLTDPSLIEARRSRTLERMDEGLRLRRRAEAHSENDMRESAWWNRPLFGDRLSKHGSHRFRFATQNLAFGVDDAIQSYHYGGIGASVRAASNNATAIAGMSISNPAIAAGTVVAISIASAILPKLLERYQIFRKEVDFNAIEAESRARRVTYAQSLASTQVSSVLGTGDSNPLKGNLNKRVELEAAAAELRRQNQDMQIQTGKLQVQAKKDEADLRERWKPSWMQRASTLVSPYHGGKELVKELLIRSGMFDPTADDKKLNREAKEKNLEEQHRIRQQMRDEETLTQKLQIEAARSRLYRVQVAEQNREEQRQMNQGRLPTLPLLERFLAKQVDERIDSIRASKSLTPQQKTTAEETVRQQLWDRLADRAENQIMLDRNNHRLWQERNAFNQSVGGDKSIIGPLTYEFRRRFADLALQQRMGELSTLESLRRGGLMAGQFLRERKRGIEDEIDIENPERNPLRRLERRSRRRLEDFFLEKDKTPNEQRDLAKAIFLGKEREMLDLLRPSGQRRFSTDAYTVNSREDFELESRMRNDFEWEKKPTNMDGKTLEEILAEIRKLNDRLKFEAERLENN